jgi:hypothetical protein
MIGEIDFSGATWKILKQRASNRLDRLRVANDAALSADQTATIRGRIMELKEFLALDKPAPEGFADEQ